MPTFSEAEMASLLEPYRKAGLAVHPEVPEETFAAWPEVLVKLSAYLELLLRWNARTNLTAIRSPEEIVLRHLGESLFVGFVLAGQVGALTRLLDFGSGAGLPGIPVQVLLPQSKVTLAESQGKKAAFLREAVRVLAIPATVWGDRVEAMPDAETFDAVMLRAVDDTERILPAAAARVAEGGYLVRMRNEALADGLSYAMPGLREGWVTLEQVGMSVPRGTLA